MPQRIMQTPCSFRFGAMLLHYWGLLLLLLPVSPGAWTFPSGLLGKITRARR